MSIALADHWRESYVCETGKSMIAVDLAGLKRMVDVNRDYTHHAARRGFECNRLFTTITPRYNPCRMLSDVGPLPNLVAPALFALFGAAAGW